jgi:hypothetical protein
MMLSTSSLKKQIPSTPIPPHQSQDQPKKKGCGWGCLAWLVGAPLAILLTGYITLFHTSLPLKWLAGTLESDSVTMTGVSGSISSGFGIEKLTIHGESGDSTIEGITFRYSGLIDSISNDQLVIEEISVESADIIAGADAFESSNEDEESSEPSGNSTTSTKGSGIKLFELQKLSITNTRYRTADGLIDVDIPAIRLEGLKVEGDNFELAKFEVISDSLDVSLADATPEEIEGQLMPFKRRLYGKVLPKIHPLVISKIDFNIEFAAVAGATKSRVTACGGSYQQTMLPDGSSIVRFTGFNLNKYMDMKSFVSPENLTTTVRETDNVVKLKDGEFFLGKTRFEIRKQEIDSSDPEAVILCQAQVEGLAVVAMLKPDKENSWPPLIVELDSKPKKAKPELLAQIYFQSAYESLTPEEKTRIDLLVKGKE